MRNPSVSEIYHQLANKYDTANTYFKVPRRVIEREAKQKYQELKLLEIKNDIIKHKTNCPGHGKIIERVFDPDFRHRDCWNCRAYEDCVSFRHIMDHPDIGMASPKSY